MGGNLAVTLILEGGQVYKMDRWTNSFPDFVNNMKFVQKDPAHIQHYLKAWLEMKEDWKKNGPNGKFEFAMTPVYFPHEEMAPSEYGLVVIDMVKNKIYSQQGYSSPGSGQRHVKGLEKNRARFNQLDKYDKEELERWDALEAAGRISIRHDFGDGFQLVNFDLSPFEVTIFPETEEQSIAYMHLLDEEYGLNDKEKEMWKQFIENHYSED